MREILLHGSNLIAFVDDEDYEAVAAHRWYVTYSSTGKPWARKSGSQAIGMHRFLLPDAPKHIDHIDGNALNNSRINLREATARQNAANTGPYKTNKSGYKGVHQAVSEKHLRKSWRASIRVHKKKVWLGNFEHAYQAALAYNIKALEVFGEFAYLNNVMAAS